MSNFPNSSPLSQLGKPVTAKKPIPENKFMSENKSVLLNKSLFSQLMSTLLDWAGTRRNVAKAEAAAQSAAAKKSIEMAKLDGEISVLMQIIQDTQEQLNEAIQKRLGL